MSDAPGERPGSRRRFLGAGMGAAGAVALAGCGGDSLKTQLRRQPAIAHSDVTLLNQLIDLEYRAVAAYTAGAPLLSPDASHAAKQFLAQELGHAQGLSILVREAGAKAIKPKASYDLGHPRTGAELLQLLHELETAQVAAYLHVIPRLRPAKVRMLAAQYFANDAQHLSIVRTLLHVAPLPAAFVTGRE